ncbi:hypothetical protein D3C84_569720 [compost metagenome]
MILAHYKGLLCVCKVLKEEGQKVYVKVLDEKRPKWVDLSMGRQKLFENTDDAIDWIEEQNK